MATKPSVYFLPVYAPGHLISMVEAAKRLLKSGMSISGNSFSVTFLLMKPNPNPFPLCESYIESLKPQNLGIQFHTLPHIEPPTEFEGPEDFVSHYILLYLPLIKTALSASDSPVLGLVLDMFASDVIDVANELNIPSYIYFPSTATFLNILLHLPSLNEKVELDFCDFEGEIEVPGIAPIPSLSMADPLMRKKSAAFKWFVHHAKRYKEAKGIIFNSNVHLEEKAIKALAENQTEIYPVGPIITIRENGSREHECLKWLDIQPEKSVVFLCFGSMGAFETSQIQQMADGLEKSGHRFLWAIRTPTNEQLRTPTDAKLEEVLPDGFLERTKERGLVWPSWTPQVEILSHKSIGGFVTHCGWNSCLESLWHGVPMIPWPLYAEQHLNAFEMVNEMGVAVNLTVDRKNKGYVSAKELERAIVCLMRDSEEGTRVRARVKEIKEACKKTVEKGGSSFVEWQKLAVELGKVSDKESVGFVDRISYQSGRLVELVS